MSISVSIKRHPVTTYYALAFAISWAAIEILLIVVPGEMINNQPLTEWPRSV